MQRYRVVSGGDLRTDLDRIESFLTQSYQSFGDEADLAIRLAASRIRKAVDDMDGLGVVPHRGIQHAAVSPGLRSVTDNKFIIYFEIDETSRQVTILAVFFGGADHRAQIIERLSGS